MAITTNDFNSLTEYLDEIFNEYGATRVAEDVGMQIFDVSDTDERTYLHQVYHGVAGIQKVSEGSNLPTINAEEGDNITFTQNYYGALVTVSKHMRRFDRYNEIENLARSIMQDAFDKLDQSMADVLLKGWSTSYTDVYSQTVTSVTPDGLALFSTAHTNGATSTTFSNVISDGTNTNPALTREAIVNQRATARKYTDPNGIHRPIRLDTIVVGPDLEDLAYRIINSDLISGSANNDKNPVGLRSMNIVVWDRLGSASDGTDTSDYWFMLDSSMIGESLNALFAQRPMLMPPEEVYENKNWEYSVDYFYTLGRGFPAYIYGSKGDNS